MNSGWRDPRRWARVGAWLLVPIVVLDWFAMLPQTVFIVFFVIAAVGLAGIAAAVTVGMLRRGRVGMGVLGVVMLLGGLAFLGLDPLPASIAGLSSWWPSVITQPQLVGSAYWTIVGLGIVLCGFGLLGTLLGVAVAGPTRARAPRR
jgi:hypothetical protein